MVDKQIENDVIEIMEYCKNKNNNHIDGYVRRNTSRTYTLNNIDNGIVNGYYNISSLYDVEDIADGSIGRLNDVNYVMDNNRWAMLGVSTSFPNTPIIHIQEIADRLPSRDWNPLDDYVEP